MLQSADPTSPVDARMRLAVIEARIDTIMRDAAVSSPGAAAELLHLGEAVMEIWIAARGGTPTQETKEGFRLIALHRQGAKGEPSFNACRETCRELVYHYNLVAGFTQPNPQVSSRGLSPGPIMPDLKHDAGDTMDPGNECRDDIVVAAIRDPSQNLRMMALVAKHLVYFVDGKMQVEGLGEFCCAAKPLRAGTENSE